MCLTSNIPNSSGWTSYVGDDCRLSPSDCVDVLLFEDVALDQLECQVCSPVHVLPVCVDLLRMIYIHQNTSI